MILYSISAVSAVGIASAEKRTIAKDAIIATMKDVKGLPWKQRNTVMTFC